MKKWDILIKNAKIFDGTGELPTRGDIAVKDGRIAARGTQLDESAADHVVQAGELWAMPGLLDIHTHYDLEVELAPGLPESVRHGTTTVVMSNCSLGLAFGAQRRDGTDPITDCFARVENMPKHVLRRAADLADWSDSGDYLRHLDEIPLGPNVVPMIPHSMLRIEAMGFRESISRDPSEAELVKMKALLEKGLREGYAGFSTDALPFHYLANDPNRHKQIPTQFAKYSELKELTGIVRELDRVWQATPPKDSPPQTLKTLLLTGARFFGKPLRTTVVAALDIATNRTIVPMALGLAWLLNSGLVKGRFALQALAAPFKVWGEGPFTPIAEEIPELRALNETDLEDRAGRARLLNDPRWIKAFRAMWYHGKRGFGPARLRRLLRLEDYAFSRDPGEMFVDQCPVSVWKDLDLETIRLRLRKHREEGTVPTDDTEAEFLAGLPEEFPDDADFLLHLWRRFDIDLLWYTVTANRDAKRTRKLLMNPRLLPGFTDSGAHLTNMAFYDCNLRALKSASEGGDKETAYMVKRLTRDPAEFFNIPAGSLEEGEAADITLIDPARLGEYEGEENVQWIHRAEFEHKQLVNRSPDVVPLVLIGGKIAWSRNRFSENFGREKFGRRLAPADAKLANPEYSRNS